jgi:hypothetical protein
LTKNAARRALFKKLGSAITKQGDPDSPDYHTGRASSFQIRNGPSSDSRPERIPFGPAFKTPHWERTSK